jgi:ethanolamine utilization protein EutA
LAKELLLTEPLAAAPRPHLVTFSGGVAEYIFGRETRDFGDIARLLAQRIAAWNGLPRMDPGQGIRATVIGASQFSVQVSGKTIHLSHERQLPLRGVPVAFPALDLERPFGAAEVAGAVRAAVERLDAAPDEPLALGLRWRGEPHYQRLRELAAGIAQAVDGAARRPLVLMVDHDVARLLGHILEHELGLARPVIAIDGVQLREFDYVDIGEVIEPTGVVPVVIKSLLFPAD